jgi:hypothetical protein
VRVIGVSREAERGEALNYPNAGYPMPPSALQPQMPAKQGNTVGLIALILSIIGFVFACIPGALIVGWVLLPAAFILSIVGLCLSGKSKGTSIAAVIISIIGVIVGAVVFFAVVADAFHAAFGKSDFGKSDFGKSDVSAPSPTPAQRTDENNQPGSRENPFPIGQPVHNEEWQVTLGAPHEAWTAIAAENQFNEPPDAGMEYRIVPVTATYTGDNTGNAGFDIAVKFVGSDNRTYDDSCGVIPNPLSDVGALYKGGSAQGNACVAVPAGAEGLWTVSTSFGDPVFFRS